MSSMLNLRILVLIFLRASNFVLLVSLILVMEDDYELKEESFDVNAREEDGINEEESEVLADVECGTSNDDEWRWG